MPTAQRIANPIRVKRQARGKTIIELAAAIGVSKQAVSYWETNEAKVADRHVPALAKFFGDDAEDFARELEEYRIAAANAA